jgi:hypothetical protein
MKMTGQLYKSRGAFSGVPRGSTGINARESTPVTHTRSTGVWFGPRAGLHGFEEEAIVCPYGDPNPGLCSQQLISVSTTLRWLLEEKMPL